MDAQGRALIVKLFDPELGQRADVMTRLEHVHATVARLPEAAVRVLDAGYDAGSGAPFSVSPLVTWPTLAQWVARGPLQPPYVARMLRSLGELLDAAHQAELFHGALKPENVFMSPGGEGHVRVADFGASVVRSASPTHESYAASAPWWAPEQVNASAVLDATTDVFTSALLAFFSLTGRTFWWSCQSQPPDLKRWQQEVMGDRPLASTRARELRAVVNPALDVAFESALAVVRSERPSSVGALAYQFGSLAGYTDDPTNPTLALDAPDLEIMSRPGLPPVPLAPPRKRRSPWIPIVIGVIGATVLGGAGLWLLFDQAGDRAEKAQADAVRPTPPARKVAPDPSAIGPDADAPPEEPSTRRDGPDASAAQDETPEEEVSPLVEVRIICTPACSSIEVDDEPVDDPTSALRLAPGRYVIRLNKPGYATRTETITVGASEPSEQKFALSPLRYRRPPKKRCSKFLKNCP